MKNNIDFYPHAVVADQHPKFAMLRVEYGWSGEGRFWALNNRIGQAEDGLLDISKKYNRAAIAEGLGFKMDEFDAFINYLLNECELIIEPEPGIITTETIQETLQKVMATRETARNRKKRNSKKIGSGEKQINSPANGGDSEEKPKSSGELSESSKNNSPGLQKSPAEKHDGSPELLESSKRFARTEQESKVKESKVKNNNPQPPHLKSEPDTLFEPQGPPSGISFKNLKSKKVTSNPMSKNNGKKLDEYFHAINQACDKIAALPKKPKQFDPYKWAQQQVGKSQHPGAIMESLEGLIIFWDSAHDPWAYALNILSKKNGNFNEQDAIAYNNELKSMKPGQLEFLTQGLLKEMP